MHGIINWTLAWHAACKWDTGPVSLTTVPWLPYQDVPVICELDTTGQKVITAYFMVQSCNSRGRNRLTRDFGNVNIADKIWTGYCINICQEQLVQLLNRTVLHKPHVSMHMGTQVMPQVVEALRYKTGGSGFDFQRVLGNFEVSYSFDLHSLALESTQPQTEMSTGRHIKLTTPPS